MKILVLTGSARIKGTSALLAEKFMEGAEAAGHMVRRYDCALLSIRDCTGCGHCVENDGECVFRDAMDLLGPAIRAADVIVFATPVYYFGMTAQLKSTLDRCYAMGDKIVNGGKKSVLLTTFADTDPSGADILVAHWRKIIEYLEWDEAGMVIAPGCTERDALLETEYPDLARKLGAEL